MKAHRTDGLSLTFGLIFLTVVAWWLVAQVVDLSLPNAGWFVAGALIVLGVLGLVGAVRSGNHRGPQGQPAPTGAPDQSAQRDQSAQADQSAQSSWSAQPSWSAQSGEVPAPPETGEATTTEIDTRRPE